MEWSITEYPVLTDADQAYISQWIEEHQEIMEQARDDRDTYFFSAALGNVSALYYYSQALSTIESLESEFRELRTSDVVGSLEGNDQIIYYNHYLAEIENLDVFIKAGYGTAGDGNDSISLSSDWAYYTLKFSGGNDFVSIQDGGHMAYVHLGDGDDTFIGNSGADAAYGSNGADNLNGGSGNDDLDGGAGDDLIAGEAGADLIYGDSGDDLLTGGTGNDFLDGGEGNYDIAIYSGAANEYTIEFNEDGTLAVSDLIAERDDNDLLVNIEYLQFSESTVESATIPGGPNDSPLGLILSDLTIDENISNNSTVALLSSTDPDAGDTHTYSLVAGDGDTDNSEFTINGDQLIINESPDFETKSSYSVRLQTNDSGGLTFEQAFTISVNDLEEDPPDIDEDGFVDEITNYQMWTASGGVDLTNRRGRTYSDSSSRMWDAVKAVETNSGFSVLVEGQRNKDGKYKVATANDEGVVGGVTRWLNERQMTNEGYEDLFAMDFNGNNSIGF